MYSCCTLKCSGENATEIKVRYDSNAGKIIESPEADTWYTVSSEGVVESGRTRINASYYFNYEDAASRTLEYKDFIILNLTEIFGAGNEPATETMDALLSFYTNNCFSGLYGNIFTFGNIFSLPRRIIGRQGNYVRINDNGSVSMSSVPNADWANWSERIYNYGMSKKDSIPIYNYVHGCLETDSMFVAHALYGRWSKNCVSESEGGHPYGCHIFEGWNAPRTYRLTNLIGKNAEDEACIFVFAPTEGGGTFGTTRIGGDIATEGLEVTPHTAKMNGSFEASKMMIPIKAITSASTAGVQGEICASENWLNICVAENTWKRIPLQAIEND